ncbi:cytosine deaminase-like metal-dependent hydrolase [Paenibacillus mucilaginosus 3016]|uniref:5-methylthioadenosine/S-adenosylhomocysteine deaminase n=2 Tax=Paenibacillus mucilaginosus TaxID=61624 RepID=H6NAL2_9BACL|nr:amidohydrolase [Paenibacillus mucilaginosus]AFC29937.1 cytosine deaminase-like metal-dependent hydrolase [Paenibacillus mucilaginosus 3016]AFH62124.1 N-ethylammeline chlorohydrolase [Paenibacillus mucilaginosus K02]WFA18597.1 amidohydrolase [Paenibacillus mucilaginosus]
MKKTRIDNGIFITMKEENPVVTGTMIMEGSRIVYIGEPPAGELGECDERVDGKGKLFLPGFVNTHGHAAMSLLRGYGDDMALQLWLQEKMWPMEAKFTAADVRSGTLLSILEMVKGGTTMFVDMYDHMNEVAKAVEESGLRACLTRGVIGLCPREVQDAKLEEAVRFAKDWHGGADGRITAMMSPHAPYTCPPDYIERIVAAAHELNLPIHTHMSETAREVQENVEQYGSRPVAHLEKLGVFSRPTLVAHGVHLTDEEIGILKQYDVRVSHNPNSNLKLASGVARVPELLKAGVLVSLGTDGAASNNNLDMLEEIRLAALIHKGVSGDPVAVPAWDALKLGTVDGARSIWLEDVGTLQPGMKADFIAMDIDQPHFFPRTNLISHVVYSATSRDVTDVCVDGRWLVRNRECLTLDEEKIMHEAQGAFERLTSA